MVLVLEIEDVAVAFGARRVLDGVTLSVAPGQRHALIGPNGAGKSTLLNAVGGWRVLARGRVRLGGRDLVRLSPDRRTRLGLGVVPQLPLGFPELPVFDHLRAALQRGRGWVRFASDVDEAARAQAHAVGLGDELASPAATLSHGQRKRLDLALALVNDPKLVLLDEPTAGLSAGETEAMVALLQTLEAALLVVEHDMDVVATLADQVSVLHEGRILTQGLPEEVARDARAQAVYLGHA